MGERPICQSCVLQTSVKHKQKKALSKILYLPHLFARKEKEERQKRVVEIVTKICLMLGKVAIGLLAGFITAAWAIPAAYEERGYSAYGGEYLLILAVITIVIYWVDKGMKKKG